MMIGYIHIDEANGAVNTHRDSYLMDSLTVVSVRRPFLIGGLWCGVGFAAFTIAFGDLLHPYEIAVTLGGALVASFAGFHVGQLKLLSRDLRGSELSDVIWGRYSTLNAVRRQIARAMAFRRIGDKS